MYNKKQLNPYFAKLHSHGGIDYKCILLSLKVATLWPNLHVKDSNIHL